MCGCVCSRANVWVRERGSVCVCVCARARARARARVCVCVCVCVCVESELMLIYINIFYKNSGDIQNHEKRKRKKSLENNYLTLNAARHNNQSMFIWKSVPAVIIHSLACPWDSPSVTAFDMTLTFTTTKNHQHKIFITNLSIPCTAFILKHSFLEYIFKQTFT